MAFLMSYNLKKLLRKSNRLNSLFTLKVYAGWKMKKNIDVENLNHFYQSYKKRRDF
ncbi:hypothetical protein pah_c029o022 [Parachlamydia acanthamoebae str. Hall's coccus]|nr:hypothetical protein pah_c029o022 [Parachlamydia acanthamoebae str. Hall's coccus]